MKTTATALFFSSALLAATTKMTTNAFVVPTIPAATKPASPSALFSWQAPPVPEAEPVDISYGEESRKYRRTVYTHNDWLKHRADDRFVRNVRSIVFSGVYKNIGKEVASTLLVSTLLIGYNALTGSYTDFEGVKHAGILSDSVLPVIGLPMAPFTLSASSLGLLLVFRTNTSYQRWDEARKNWGFNINHTRDLVRMASAYYDRTGVPDDIVKQDLDRVALCTWAFVRSMKRHLSPEWEDEDEFAQELRERLPAKQAEKILEAAHRPNRALQDLSFAIEALPMHFMRKNELQRSLTVFENNLGGSERLLTSPVPLFYSRHTARFTAIYLLALPLGMYGQFSDTWNHIGMIPSVGAIAIALFGIEELATQLEEPFTILPMQAFCDKIYNWCMEIVSFQPNDNEMFTPEYLARIEELKEEKLDGANEMERPEENMMDDEVSHSSSADTSEPTSKRSRLRSLIFDI